MRTSKVQLGPDCALTSTVTTVPVASGELMPERVTDELLPIWTASGVTATPGPAGSHAGAKKFAAMNPMSGAVRPLQLSSWSVLSYSNSAGFIVPSVSSQSATAGQPSIPGKGA